MKSVFDPDFDYDLGMSQNDKLHESIADHLSRCQSCNVPLVNHLGLFGTCQELIDARKRCEELAATLRLRDETIRQLQRGQTND